MDRAVKKLAFPKTLKESNSTLFLRQLAQWLEPWILLRGRWFESNTTEIKMTPYCFDYLIIFLNILKKKKSYEKVYFDGAS